MGTRPDRIRYYLDIADSVSKRSTCLRRRFGAIIVKNDVIVSTGYNGAPRGRKNCTDIGECDRIKNNIPHGSDYTISCKSCHAEANAIIFAGYKRSRGGTLYLSGREGDTGELIKNASPCEMCRRLIINAGIHTVIVNDPSTEKGYKDFYVYADWVSREYSTPKYGDAPIDSSTSV